MEALTTSLNWLMLSAPAFLFFALGFYAGHLYTGKAATRQQEFFDKALSVQKESFERELKFKREEFDALKETNKMITLKYIKIAERLIDSST